jgi:hypothetical protein
LNHPIGKFCSAIGPILLGLTLQWYGLAAAGSATANYGARVTTFTIADGSLFGGRSHTPFSQTDQVILAGEERAGEQNDMDDDASASLHFSQSSHPAHKAYCWIAQSGYLPNNSGRSLRERSPPVSHL